jgi:uncharacterized membrane protein
MGSSHSHLAEDVDLGPTPRGVVAGLVALIVPLVLATGVGLLVLWPDEDVEVVPPGYAAQRAHGTVLDVHPCKLEVRGCKAGTVELSSGPGAPDEVEALLPFGEQAPVVEAGDRIVLSFVEQAPRGEQYSFQDFDRTQPLGVLLVVFVLAVLLLSRWRGLGSLVSLGFTLLVLVTFTLPAIMQGGPPLAIAVVTAATVMVVTLYLSHGFSVRTSVAMVGTLVSLVVIGLLGSVFSQLGQFTGMVDEGSQYIATVARQVDLTGLLLAGLVIGALGVLDDVTVTQTWAVWELADADPTATRATLFRRAMRIGRSHVASTVNTLVLAYVGATLPLLLVFSALELPFGSAVSQEIVAQEVVRGLVGGLGIVAAVPVTTAVAAVVAASAVRSYQDRSRPAGSRVT